MNKKIDPIYFYRKKQEFRVSEDDLTTAIFHLELNVCELCSRRCVFCPRSNPEAYANRELFMTVETAEKLGKSLAEIDYGKNGQIISISGFGEPTMNKNLTAIISTLRRLVPKTRIELITNGDFLNVESIKGLTSAGTDIFLINLYDSEDQAKKFDAMFSEADLDNYLFRRHYFGPEDDYGLTLNNRAGNIPSMPKVSEPIKRSCYLPFYKLVVDWNGNYILCCNDWSRTARIEGNIENMSIKDYWLSSKINEYRKKLILGDRSAEPCDKCNIGGTLHGSVAFTAFKKYLKMQ